jgi:hypothetical protein
MPTVEASGSQAADTVRSISSTTNATPIAVTMWAVLGFSTGDRVSITGHLVNTAANGVWTVTVTSTTAFTLDGSVGNGVGAATGTVGKHVQLASVATAKTYVLAIDTSPLVLGDVLEVRVRKKVLTGGTVRDVATAYFAHPQAGAIKESIPIVADFGVVCTIAQVAGTARTFDWALRSL